MGAGAFIYALSVCEHMYAFFGLFFAYLPHFWVIFFDHLLIGNM